MKNVLLKVIATIFISFVSISLVYPGEWIEKVVVDKEFEINPNAKLIIDHEFGSVHCENWDKDIISVVATVKVKTRNEEKAMEIIDNVIVEVKGNMSKVEAICDLNQKYRKNKKSEVHINFEIKMPESISLELESRFGSAYIESLSGPSDLTSEYGSLYAGSLGNEVNMIDISFGDLSIDDINKGDIEINYSHMAIVNAEVLSLESDYSDIEITKSTKISLELEGGNARINKVEQFDMESAFANIEIDYLGESLSGETEYGSLKVRYIDKDFESVFLSNDYGAIDLHVDKSSSYNLTANGSYGNIKYPEKYANISYSNISKSSSSIKGVVGNQSDPKSSITVKSSYGSVNISGS